MFRFERKSLRKRVSELERDVQYKEMYFADTGTDIEVEKAISLLFRHLNLEVGLQKKDASKTS